MCGRYVVEGFQELSERFQLRQVPLELFPTYNAAPSQLLPVIVEAEDGERRLRLLSWGLLPRWRKPGGDRTVAPINARAETLLEKPMFRPLVRGKRCLVPANGFYEWRREGSRKQPYLVRLRQGELFALAGLYDELPDEEGGSYTIVTTAPNALVAPLHDRMPAILRPEDEDDWLDRGLTDPEAAKALLRPYPPEAMELVPVSPAVNDVRNDGEELVAPIGR